MKFNFKKPPTWYSWHSIFSTLQEKYPNHTPAFEKWEDRIADSKIGEFVMNVLNFRYEKLTNNRVKIRVDSWDAWSADYTIAVMAVAILKELRKVQNSAGHIDDEDVPEHLRSTAAEPLDEKARMNGETDSNWFKRYNWVLDEIIWALEQIADDEKENQFYDFGADDEVDIEDLINGTAPLIKFDREGWEAWQKRKSNGLRLFGKYFESLWW